MSDRVAVLPNGPAGSKHLGRLAGAPEEKSHDPDM